MAVCKCVYRTGDRATFPYTQSQTELITISERDIHRLDDEVVVRVRADCRQGVEAAELNCEVERERLIDAEAHWRRGRVGEIGEQRAARTDDLGRLADGRRQVAAARGREPRRRVGQVLRCPISIREPLAQEEGRAGRDRQRGRVAGGDAYVIADLDAVAAGFR